MKNKLIIKLIGAALLTLVSSITIGKEQTNVVDQYQHTGKQYPPVFFVTNIENVKFEEELSQFGAFSDISKESVGLPIGLRVLKGHRTKQDGTQFSSLMLSASTLGIIPIVQNTEFKVHYEVWVQGKLIKTFKYQMDSTDVNNIWTSNYSSRETKPTEEVFIVDTLPQFLTELAKEDELQAVFNEYWLYFK